ncbi:hypothetical protein GY45DRAFT_866615 [Cubamyces sp. BRFM 1775]|nr:hypothetical protein GY45DRAFT_866615 [Cubamyces sp. BRFM 1775]
MRSRAVPCRARQDMMHAPFSSVAAGEPHDLNAGMECESTHILESRMGSVKWADEPRRVEEARSGRVSIPGERRDSGEISPVVAGILSGSTPARLGTGEGRSVPMEKKDLLPLLVRKRERGQARWKRISPRPRARAGAAVWRKRNWGRHRVQRSSRWIARALLDEREDGRAHDGDCDEEHEGGWGGGRGQGRCQSSTVSVSVRRTENIAPSSQKGQIQRSSLPRRTQNAERTRENARPCEVRESVPGTCHALAIARQTVLPSFAYRLNPSAATQARSSLPPSRQALYP